MNDSRVTVATPETSGDGVRGRIRDFIFSTFYVPDADRLSDDTSLLESGVVDSTGVLEVLAFLEKDFGVRVDDSEVTPENLDSIGRLTCFVSRKLGRDQG